MVSLTVDDEHPFFMNNVGHDFPLIVWLRWCVCQLRSPALLFLSVTGPLAWLPACLVLS